MQIDKTAAKKELRRFYTEVRGEITKDARREKDRLILNNILSLSEYKSAKVLLCYVSCKTEVDTKELIRHALNCGKAVAAPLCVSGSRVIDFYRIRSLDDLSVQSFGILEPNTDICEKIVYTGDSVCIIPALACDQNGFRLGYGGGYYDRFLSSGFSGVAVGVCYSECVVDEFPREQHDIPCDILVTDKFIKLLT